MERRRIRRRRRAIQLATLLSSANIFSQVYSFETSPRSPTEFRTRWHRLWSSPPLRSTDGSAPRHRAGDMEGQALAAAAAATTMRRKPRRPKLNKKWNTMMERLEAFHRDHGHALVTEENHAGDVELWRWTQTVRRNYRHQVLGPQSPSEGYYYYDDDDDDDDDDEAEHGKGKIRPWLCAEKMERLQSLGFVWDVQSILWQERYEQLQEYVQQHGHGRVKLNDTQYPGLGIWVRNQRREYRRLEQGQRSTLTESRLQALVALNFEWYRSREEAWEFKYEQLREFHRKFGHAHVPEDDETNFSLGQWCMNQRTAYRRYQNMQPTALTPERIAKLEQLQFPWSFRETQWERMLKRVVRYHRENGHVQIPRQDACHQDLRVWMILQRYNYNRRRQGLPSPMNDERIQALKQSIPDWAWKVRQETGGPSSDDWAKLFDAMRGLGIQPGMRPKQHWFEGINPFSVSVKETWTEQDLLELWNQDGSDFDEDSEGDT